MSIATEITRLQTAKADLKTAIEGKGVTVPSATLLDGYADLVDSISGGGSGLQSGSFIGTTSRAITVPVTALCSKYVVWATTPKGDDDLTNNPYGVLRLVGAFVDNDNGFFYMTASNAYGTAWTGGGGCLGRWGSNTAWNNVATFTSSSIKLATMGVGGGGVNLIDGETYNWVAW